MKTTINKSNLMVNNYYIINYIWRLESKAEEKNNSKNMEKYSKLKILALESNDKQLIEDLKNKVIDKDNISFELRRTFQVASTRIYNKNTYHNPKTGYLEWKEGTPDYIQNMDEILGVGIL